jgi:hypothetical protein
MNMKLKTVISPLILATLCCFLLVSAQTKSQIPAGSKIFINPMGGFETFLKAAMENKKVPLVVVEDKAQADFEIIGTSNSQKASTMKKILGNWHSREEAGINMVNIKTSETVFAYSVHKEASAHGKKSTAEACAKHLKERVIIK